MQPTRFLPLTLLLIITLMAAACAGDTDTGEMAEADTAAVTTPETPGASEGIARLGVVEQDPYGAFVADADGSPLYLFTADAQGDSSACYDACAQAWPPLLSTDEPVAVAPRMEADLLGRIERRDGSMQVTYNGWPLYYFQQDQGADRVQGQDVHGFGGEWYLVTPEGNKLEAEGEEAEMES